MHLLDPSARSNFPAPKLHAIAAYVLESGRMGASFQKYHFFPAKMVHNGARMANGVQTAALPCIFPSVYKVRSFYTSLGLVEG